jgi:Tol biopolymer transport system component
VQHIDPFDLYPYYFNLDVTKDGEWLVFVSAYRMRVCVYQLNNNKYEKIQTFYYGGRDGSISISDDHLFLVSSSYYRYYQVKIHKFNTNSFSLVQTIYERAFSVDLSADGEWLAIGGYFYSYKSWVYHL